jgi:hypothetical protein
VRMQSNQFCICPPLSGGVATAGWDAALTKGDGGGSGSLRQDLRAQALLSRAAAPPSTLNSQPSTRSKGDFSPLWSGQNPSGCRENPAAWATQQLAASFGKQAQVAEPIGTGFTNGSVKSEHRHRPVKGFARGRFGQLLR